MVSVSRRLQMQKMQPDGAMAFQDLQVELLNAENLLIASNFVEASKAAETVLMQLYADNATLDSRTRAWYVLIQSHYMQKDLQPLQRLLLQHRLPIRVLPPRVILLWALVHLELGHTARARDDLKHWLMYSLIDGATSNPLSSQSDSACDTATKVTNHGASTTPADDSFNHPVRNSTSATATVPITSEIISHVQGETKGPDYKQGGSTVMEEISTIVSAQHGAASTQHSAMTAQHSTGSAQQGTGSAQQGTGSAQHSIDMSQGNPNFGNTNNSAGKTSPAAPGILSRSLSQKELNPDEVNGDQHGRDHTCSKQAPGVIVAPASWELSADDALALARLFAVEIMGKARAEFSAARRWLQSEAGILTVSQVQMLLQELENAELVRIQEEEMLTQHAAQQATETLESPESDAIPALLNPQLRRRWRGGAGGPSSNFLTMTGDMDELTAQADWPTTPAQVCLKDAQGHRVQFSHSPTASQGAMHSAPASPSGFSRALSHSTAWVQLLWKALQRHFGASTPPKLLLLALCCAMFGFALHSERSGIQRTALVVWQKVKQVVMEAAGMALVLNTNPIATASAQHLRRQ